MKHDELLITCQQWAKDGLDMGRFFVRPKNHVNLTSIHGNLNLFIGCKNPLFYLDSKQHPWTTLPCFSFSSYGESRCFYTYPAMLLLASMSFSRQQGISVISFPFFWLPSLRPHYNYSYSPSIRFKQLPWRRFEFSKVLQINIIC